MQTSVGEKLVGNMALLSQEFLGSLYLLLVCPPPPPLWPCFSGLHQGRELPFSSWFPSPKSGQCQVWRLAPVPQVSPSLRFESYSRAPWQIRLSMLICLAWLPGLASPFLWPALPHLSPVSPGSSSFLHRWHRNLHITSSSQKSNLRCSCFYPSIWWWEDVDSGGRHMIRSFCFHLIPLLGIKEVFPNHAGIVCEEIILFFQLHTRRPIWIKVFPEMITYFSISALHNKTFSPLTLHILQANEELCPASLKNLQSPYEGGWSRAQWPGGQQCASVHTCPTGCQELREPDHFLPAHQASTAPQPLEGEQVSLARWMTPFGPVSAWATSFISYTSYLVFDLPHYEIIHNSPNPTWHHFCLWSDISFPGNSSRALLQNSTGNSFSPLTELR